MPLSAQSTSLRAVVCVLPAGGWGSQSTRDHRSIMSFHAEVSGSGYRSGSCTAACWRCFDALGKGEAGREELTARVRLSWLKTELLGACRSARAPPAHIKQSVS